MGAMKRIAQPPGYVSSAEPAPERLDDGARTCYRRRMLMLEFKLVSKSISDAGWRTFRSWLDYLAKVYGKRVIAVPPQYSTQECSRCGTRVTKTLSQRTHVCLKCGLVLGRDHNAVRTILGRGLTLLTPPTAGHAESHAWGEQTRYAARSSVLRKASR